VSHADVVRAIHEYDRLGADRFFSAHGSPRLRPTICSGRNAVTRRRRFWGRLTSSPPAGGSAPGISRAGRPGLSRCWEGSGSRSSRGEAG